MSKSVPLVVALALGGCVDMSPTITRDDGALPAELETLDRTADPTCAGTWVAGVLGSVVDETGRAVAGAYAQMCVRGVDGEFDCLAPPDGDAQGRFVQVVPPEVRCMGTAALRVSRPGSGLATTYAHVDLAPEDAILRFREPFVLHHVDPAIDMPPRGDPGAARTVGFEDGLELDVIPVVLGDRYEELAARRVPASEWPDFARGAAGLRGLYAFEPEMGTRQGFPVRIPDDLPDGTRVELLVLGGLATFLPDGRQVEEADFEVYGGGVARGGVVVGDGDGALPYLSWMGWRVAP